MIGGTHGNEPIGVEALKELETRMQNFDWIIGNPRALENNTREFEGDLNRSAPGSLDAPNYASRRAAEILELAQKYTYVIDLHGTNAFSGLFVIVTNPSRANFDLAVRLGIQNIVYWPSFSPELSGPLSEYVPCGVEIECGPKQMPRVRRALVEKLECFLRAVDVQATPADYANCKFFDVYGSVRLDEGLDITELQEFTEVNHRGETFFPLLVGEYARAGVACYKMRLTSRTAAL